MHPHWTRSELAASALGYAGKKGGGTPGRNFACNLRVRSAALYTLSYGSLTNGGLGWICTINLPIQRRALCSLSYKALEVEAHPGLAPGKSVLQTDGSTALPCAPRSCESGETSGIRTRHDGFHRAECCCYIMISIWKWIRLPVPPRSGLVYTRVHALLCQAGIEWPPRMDLRHQPPESESGALLIELQG